MTIMEDCWLFMVISMQCLHPICIKVDRKRLNPLPSLSSNKIRYKDVRPYINDSLPVPCGKCIACLRNKQNAMVSRILSESQKRGTFQFLTLTYDDQHLPLAQSLWRISKETGETECLDKGEVIVSARSSHLKGVKKEFQDTAKQLREYFNANSPKPSEKPRYLDKYIPYFEDSKYKYFSRITPSVCREDVRLWLKSARVQYEREHGKKLSDFSYVAVGEYGPRTCRPHYHLALFGLSSSEAIWLSDYWKYGYRLVKSVYAVNPDGSNGFQIAARYIGKYMSKGKFDCESVKNCSAEKPRVCQSKGIGSSLIEKVRSQCLGFDLYGEYDIDTFYCPSLRRRLNDNEIRNLVKVIPSRLVYDAGNGFKLPIPRLFRDKIFYKEHYEYRKSIQFDCGSPFRKQSDCDRSGKEKLQKVVKKIPSSLWSLVSDSIRTNFLEDDFRKYKQYLSRFGTGADSCAPYEFAIYGEACNKISENSFEENYINFLSHSNF